MVNIKNSLEKLEILEKNNGSSTGSVSWGEGKVISSVSPVDGKTIAGVTSTTAEEWL